MSSDRRIARGSLALVAVLAASFVPAGIAHADVTPPSPIASVRAYVHNGGVTFNWTLPASSPSPIIATVIRGSAQGSPDPTAWNSNDGYTITSVQAPYNVGLIDGLAPGTDFNFSIFTVTGTVGADPTNASQDTVTAGSTPVSLTLHGSDLSITTSKTTLAYGAATKLTAKLVRSATGAPIVGVEVDFFARVRGTRRWLYIPPVLTDTTTRVMTNSQGIASVSFPPAANEEMQAVFYGAAYDFGEASGLVQVSVAPTITNVVNRTTEKLHQSLSARGTVAAESTFPSTHVYVERYYSGTWHASKTVSLTGKTVTGNTATHKYAFSIKSTKRGTFYYRVTARATSLHVAAHSKTFKVKVT